MSGIPQSNRCVYKLHENVQYRNTSLAVHNYKMESIRHFQKKLAYKNCNNNKLDLGSFNEFDDSYQFEEFVELRADYISKNEILFKDMPKETWIKIGSTYNLSKHIYTVENKMKFENFLKPWGKIYEVLEEFQLISNSDGHLNTLHLEEEMGAMVCAMNHFLQSKYREVSQHIKYSIV